MPIFYTTKVVRYNAGMKTDEPISLESLDLAYLAYFAGMQFNRAVLDALHAAGHAEVRQSHGFVIQHLVAGPLLITELAQRMGVTQQAASKSVAEMESLGYLEAAPSKDARSRPVRLSRRGRALLASGRKRREELLSQCFKDVPGCDQDATRRTLVHCLEFFGGVEAVQGRRVREPQ